MQEEGKETEENKSTEQGNGYASLKEVAETFQVSVKRLKDWIKRGILPAVKPSRRIRVSLDAVRKLIDDNTINRDKKPD